MNTQRKNSLLLLLCAFIWGTAFVAQSAGSGMGACSFLAGRSWLAVLVLLPTVKVFDLMRQRSTGTTGAPKTPEERRCLRRASLVCGTLLFVASAAQQFGLTLNPSTAKAGFLTAMYVVLVPIFGLALGRRGSPQLWLSVAIAVCGLYLLCMQNGFGGVERSDMVLLLCAVLFSFQIMAVNHYGPQVDGVRLSLRQFFVVAVESSVAALLLEHPAPAEFAVNAVPLLYCGVMSSGVAYTLQILGQRDMNPAVGSLIMCLESVFSALGGWVLLHQSLSPREGVGCVLIFAAVVLAQLPLEMLHRAKKLNPDAAVVAAGCYVQTKEDEAKCDEAIDILIGNNQKKELVERLDAFFAGRGEKVEAVVDINHEKQAFEELTLDHAAEHTRAFIKVQDGCNQFCSYCIIPYARGRVRSRNVQNVLEEVKRLAASGYQEVVLTGIHLSSYGIDCEESLLHLIQMVHQVEGIRRIRLGSLEPRIVTETFAEELAKMEKICPHFHLSLQSGCDATLARMNRKYTTEEYENACSILRKNFTHPAITTDVIVGFPGETEEEFAQTKEYLKRIHFYEMHIFKYSRRQGTRAAVMEHQVPEEIKTKRSAQLLALAESMSREFRAYYVGKEEEVLFEEPMEVDGETWYTGYTKEYVKIAAKTAEPLDNVMKRGRVEAALTDEIYRMKL